MSNIFTNIKQTYWQGSMPIKFIYINVAVFLITTLFQTILLLFNIDASPIIKLFELRGWMEAFLQQPWSLITYMFMHADIFHLLFNMLWLYWFGQLFTYFFSERSFCGLYIWGGILGGILYLLSFNIFPYYRGVVYNSHMVGASASILALTIATAVREPDFKVRLLFIGEISLKYIALIMFGIDLLLITSQNAGGHIAHLGGALAGWWFATSMRKGRDITQWINVIIDKIADLFAGITNATKGKKKAKMKVHYNFKEKEKDYDYNARKKERSEEIDRILDKLKKSGYDSLTTEEKKRLFDASKE